MGAAELVTVFEGRDHQLEALPPTTWASEVCINFLISRVHNFIRVAEQIWG